MQELETRQSNGESSPDSWLIFGNPHLRSDFLYQREWLQWRESGLLNRIDVAFSRDQAEKVYVQHIVEQQAADIAEWIARGASVYICGALGMGQSVQDALQTAIAQQHGLDEEGAVAAMGDLRRSKRIHKDLY
jgi:sulfite reductase (NADPH) flavoprotein alpha-component